MEMKDIKGMLKNMLTVELSAITEHREDLRKDILVRYYKDNAIKEFTDFELSCTDSICCAQVNKLLNAYSISCLSYFEIKEIINECARWYDEYYEKI